MKIHNIEQCSPEWFELRAKKMTASHANTIQANGKGLKTYITDMMAESYSSAEPENYTNAHMERGNELEPMAREVYELENDVKVEQVGFIERDEYSGCSPDGLVGDEGMIEIKCHADKKHFRLILNGSDELDKKYIDQMQMQMLVAGREWADMVCYNPNFKQSSLVFRIEADEAMFKKLEAGLAKGKELINEIENKL